MPDTEHTLAAARGLLAGSFQGVLATSSLACPGYPFGSLVPYCLDGAGRPLLLLSHLAQHTRNLLQDPRASLTVVQRGDGDPQRLQRLTCTADATALAAESEALSERYFRYFPQTREYFTGLHFRFFRLDPQRFHFVGGFGAARWISPERLGAENRFAPESETRLLERVNTRLAAGPELAASLARQVDLEPSPPVVVAGLDPEGGDLRQHDRLRRLEFGLRAQDPDDAVRRLLSLAEDQAS